MQKQLQKFGFFGSKALDEETNSKINDKTVKYLYKKETGSSYKRKIKSADYAETARPRKHSSKRYLKDDESRKRRKKSTDSVRRKHRNGSLTNAFASETEIYFISPEEIKKHRKKLRKSVDKSPEREKLESKKQHSPLNTEAETEKKKRRKQVEEIAKLIKEYKHRLNDSNEDYQWLTKKEIFKLMQELPKTASTSFLKKYFVFEKNPSVEQIKPLKEHHSKKEKHRYSEDNTLKESLSDAIKKEKITKKHVKKIEEPVNVLYPQEFMKHHEKEKSLNKHKEEIDHHQEKNKSHHSQKKNSESEHHEIISSKLKKKSRPIEKEQAPLVFEELKIVKETKKKTEKGTESRGGNVQTAAKAKTKKREKSSDRAPLIENAKISQSKVVTPEKNTDRVASVESSKKTDSKAENICGVNPVRHRFCLVKSTFSVVDILSEKVQNDTNLEKKKKLKAFKKYYKYSRNTQDGESEISTTYHTFSDSHKLYQDVSEQSIEDTFKNRYKLRPQKVKSDQKHTLKIQTQVSTIVINPEPHQMYFVKVNEQQEKKTHHNILEQVQNQTEKKEKNNRVQKQKSKIPVLTNCSKIVQLATEPPISSKSYKKSAELFANIKLPTKEDKEKVTKERSPSPKLLVKNVGEKSETTSKASDKLNNKSSRPASAKIKTKDVEIFVKEKKPLKRAKKELKTTEKAYVSKQSKVSSENKKTLQQAPSAKNEKKHNRSPSSPPTTHRKENTSQMGSDSPRRLSRDGSSSNWSKSTRRSIKTTPLASKSDTKIHRNEKTNSKNNNKNKSCDRSSAITSVSNSTFKSLDSSKIATTYLLTKNFKDEEKLNRWQKRKLYADSVRKNLINKNQNKSSIIPPQVMEVRYLTVEKKSSDFLRGSSTNLLAIEDNKEKSPSVTSIDLELETKNKDHQDTGEEFYEKDIPGPYFELMEDQKFKELCELPMDEALNEILNENYNFLKKDFSYAAVNFDTKSSSSDLSLEETPLLDKKFEDWYDFRIANGSRISDISSCPINYSVDDAEDFIVGSEDHIVDSVSAPGSEESGYATIKSRQISKSFFERPNIKALFHPQTTTDYCFVQIERESSSHCGLEIRSIESKSLQTSIECSQKSVQIKMSQEERLESIRFSDHSGGMFKSEEATEEIYEEVVFDDRNGNRLDEEQQRELTTERKPENLALTGLKKDHRKEETRKDIADVVVENQMRLEQNFDTEKQEMIENTETEVIVEQNEEEVKKEIVTIMEIKKSENEMKSEIEVDNEAKEKDCEKKKCENNNEEVNKTTEVKEVDVREQTKVDSGDTKNQSVVIKEAKTTDCLMKKFEDEGDVNTETKAESGDCLKSSNEEENKEDKVKKRKKKRKKIRSFLSYFSCVSSN